MQHSCILHSKVARVNVPHSLENVSIDKKVKAEILERLADMSDHWSCA